jgi:hypothetical protein
MSIRRVKQRSNIGAEANVMHVAALAQGQYIYILGSDDILLAGALQEIRSSLTQYAPDVMTFGYSVQLSVSGRLVDTATIPYEPGCYQLSRGCAALFSSLPDLSTSFMFLSSFVIKSTVWHASDSVDCRWVGTQYRHTYKIHYAIRNHVAKRAVVLSGPLVRAGSDPFDEHLPEGSCKQGVHVAGNEMEAIFSKHLLFYDTSLMIGLAKDIYGSWANFPKGLLRSFRRSHSIYQILQLRASCGLRFVHEYYCMCRTMPLGWHYILALGLILRVTRRGNSVFLLLRLASSLLRFKQSIVRIVRGVVRIVPG